MKEITLRARLILLAPKGKEGAITEALTAGEAVARGRYAARHGANQDGVGPQVRVRVWRGQHCNLFAQR